MGIEKKQWLGQKFDRWPFSLRFKKNYMLHIDTWRNFHAILLSFEVSQCKYNKKKKREKCWPGLVIGELNPFLFFLFRMSSNRGLGDRESHLRYQKILDIILSTFRVSFGFFETFLNRNCTNFTMTGSIIRVAVPFGLCLPRKKIQNNLPPQ